MKLDAKTITVIAIITENTERTNSSDADIGNIEVNSDPTIAKAVVEVIPDKVLTVSPVKTEADKSTKEDELSVTKQITTVYLKSESS